MGQVVGAPCALGEKAPHLQISAECLSALVHCLLGARPWDPSPLLCPAMAQDQCQRGLVTSQASGRFQEPQSNKWSKNRALNPESRKAGL